MSDVLCRVLTVTFLIGFPSIEPTLQNLGLGFSKETFAKIHNGSWKQCVDVHLQEK